MMAGMKADATAAMTAQRTADARVLCWAVSMVLCWVETKADWTDSRRAGSLAGRWVALTDRRMVDSKAAMMDLQTAAGWVVS